MIKFLGSFLLHPILWLAIIAVCCISYRRIYTERRQFSIAVTHHYVEVGIFFKTGGLFGLVASIITLLLGVTVDRAWLSWYAILTVLALALFALFWDSGIVLAAVGLCAYFSPNLRQLTLFVAPDKLQGGALLSGGLLILSFSLMALAVICHRAQRFPVSPTIEVSKRGIRQATYHVRQLYLMPLILLVPGDSIGHLFAWWPVFSVGNQRFSLILLPLIIGLHLRLKKRLPFELKKLQSAYFISGVIALVFAVMAGLQPSWYGLDIAALAVVIALRGYVGHFLSSGQSYVVEPATGIRVLAVQAGTPAQKAKLHPGDVVLSVNHHPVDSQMQFYEMVQLSATFVNLKVATLQRDMKLAQTAVYIDSPHELGLFTFPDHPSQETRRQT